MGEKEGEDAPMERTRHVIAPGRPEARRTADRCQSSRGYIPTVSLSTVDNDAFLSVLPRNRGTYFIIDSAITFVMASGGRSRFDENAGT